MASLASLSTASLRDAFVAAHEQGDAVTADACWAIFTSRHLATGADPIVTWHAFPPIPDRGFDWGAHRDSDEGGESLMGWGRTEAEAVIDLVALERERAEQDEELAAIAAVEREEYLRDEAADAKRDAMRDDAADLARIADEDADVPDDWAFLPAAE
jgi:hypothetical protein